MKSREGLFYIPATFGFAIGGFVWAYAPGAGRKEESYRNSYYK